MAKLEFVDGEPPVIRVSGDFGSDNQSQDERNGSYAKIDGEIGKMSKRMIKKICAKCGERPAHGNSKFCNECRLENKRDYRKKYRREVRHGLKYVSPESFEALVAWCEAEGIREIVGRVAK